LQFSYFILQHLDTGSFLDPIAIVSDTGESSWCARLATISGSKGGGTDEDTIESQWAAGITLAGGGLVGGVNAEDPAGHDQASEGFLAFGVGDDGKVHVLQIARHGGGLVGGETPSGGNSGLSLVGGVAVGDGRQANLVHGSREGHGRSLDQGDVVADGQSQVAFVLPELRAADDLGELGASTDSGTVVDGHGGGTILEILSLDLVLKDGKCTYPSVQ